MDNSTSKIKNCLNCKNEFMQKITWQITCSYKCSYQYQNSKIPKFLNNNSCKRCGISLVGKRKNAIYCTKLCKSLDFNFHYRTKSRFAGKVRRMDIIERDRWRCYMCNALLEFSQIELDHLIPHSRGGSSESSNLAVSCMQCNRSKGSRIGIRQLEKLFELRNSLDN